MTTVINKKKCLADSLIIMAMETTLGTRSKAKDAYFSTAVSQALDAGATDALYQLADLIEWTHPALIEAHLPRLCPAINSLVASQASPEGPIAVLQALLRRWDVLAEGRSTLSATFPRAISSLAAAALRSPQNAEGTTRLQSAQRTNSSKVRFAPQRRLLCDAFVHRFGGRGPIAAAVPTGPRGGRGPGRRLPRRGA